MRVDGRRSKMAAGTRLKEHFAMIDFLIAAALLARSRLAASLNRH